MPRESSVSFKLKNTKISNKMPEPMTSKQENAVTAMKVLSLILILKKHLFGTFNMLLNYFRFLRCLILR
jgi:hypothetical protein